ncbi:hypothetical protein [Leptothoe kymatousa]|uniref:Uncharacterized protein n=1 Tax=Leptothoe kymatousa TAU-MAC 1615 TaxID=2364775 RepID=A0ABS5Y4I9_9CYAN|nr:hypothetical protein [Leptothoe kymatousa]MBT9312727.1 hypothetical protein [Leptothoe kymatousa TAU-MAC 1615]
MCSSLNVAPIAGVILTLGITSPVLGQTVPAPSQGFWVSANVVAALAYPSSSQRFFDAGRAQFEQEIKRLSEPDEQTEPLLTLQSEALEQFEQQPENQS